MLLALKTCARRFAMPHGFPFSLDLLVLLDLLFLCVFMSGGSTLMLVVLINRQRVRGVALSWLRPRHMPAWIAAVAFGAVLVLLCVALRQGQAAQAVRLAGYAAGCGFLFVAALLGGTTLVTRRGVAKSVNRCWDGPGPQALAWEAVRDYFVREAGQGAQRYVFFYVEKGTEWPAPSRRRFEVTVPAAHAGAFARLVRFQVDERLERCTRLARSGRTRVRR